MPAFRCATGAALSCWLNIQTAAGVVRGIGHQHCRIVQRSDGYGYHLEASQQKKESGDRADAKRRALSLPALKDRVSRAIPG